MAVKTIYTIQHSCRHIAERDLSKKPAGQRAGFASWLAKQPCTTCFSKSKSREDQKAGIADAEHFENQNELPKLDGSEKQLMWAPIFRHKLIFKAHELLVDTDQVMTEEEFEDRIMVPARRITGSGWWMDNHDCEVEDLEELVTTAIDDAAVPTASENPF
ncbi:hypothetical protein MB46_19920 (plasmid) [Arthrobacter alpinus]|uniref:hypothetical protein n=1 Tax=Arthrobacter alpinus TaxID=656366 RepID=UPI0005C8B062|nr:hypothetical protein [Arthrobacter alpinus]ALV47934.1 hypothetical protein MB46_19920 [Arthrobacter alpinus]